MVNGRSEYRTVITWPRFFYGRQSKKKKTKSRMEFTKEIKQGNKRGKNKFLQSMEIILLGLISTEPLGFDKLYFVHNSACVASKE